VPSNAIEDNRMRIVMTAATLAGALLIGWPTTANAQPVCQDWGGTTEADQLCRVHVENSTYMLDMDFPVDYPDQGALTDYLSQTRDGFINVAEMPGSWNLPYALDVKSTRYGSGSPTEGTSSVELEVYQNVGGAHPSTWYKTFNYNLARKAPITFDTLFRPDAAALPAIFPIVQREFAKQLGEAIPISPVDGLDPVHYQNFAITDDEVIFFFDQGELLAGAAGALVAHVPRSAIPPLAV
jgi:hypothetical protein